MYRRRTRSLKFQPEVCSKEPYSLKCLLEIPSNSTANLDIRDDAKLTIPTAVQTLIGGTPEFLLAPARSRILYRRLTGRFVRLTRLPSIWILATGLERTGLSHDFSPDASGTQVFLLQ